MSDICDYDNKYGINVVEISPRNQFRPESIEQRLEASLFPKKMSLSQNLSHIDFYNHFFEPRPSLIFMATTSALITPVSVGLFYFTIWFEINDPDARRSLINRLVTPICSACIIYLLLPQTIDIVRYFYGPLPDKVFFFNIYTKNAVNLAGEFFYIFLLLAR